MARPATGQHQSCRRAADGIAVNADGAERRRDQPAHLEIAETNHGDGLLRGRTTIAQQTGAAQAGHESDGVRIIGGKHRVDAGQIRQRDNAARGVALQDQPARRFRAERLGRIPESVPAPRGPRIVATDEGETVAALRHEMPRYRFAGGVIVEAGNGVDRRRRKIPGLASGRRDSNAESM